MDPAARPQTRASSSSAAASSSSVADPLETSSANSSPNEATTASSSTWSFWGQSQPASVGSSRYREMIAAAELETQLLRLELRDVERHWATEHEDLIQQLALKDETIWQLAQSASEGGIASKHIAAIYDPPAAAKPKPPRIGERPKPPTVPSFALRAAGAMVMTPNKRALRDQAPRVSKPAWNDGHDGGAFNKKIAKASAAMPNGPNLKKQMEPLTKPPLPAQQKDAQQKELQQRPRPLTPPIKSAGNKKKQASPKKPPGKKNSFPKNGAKKSPAQKAKAAASAAANAGHQESAA